MDWSDIDWAALERLRAAFLAGSAGEHDYWADERDLLSYDQTFAQRIGWKWDYVLEELQRRGWAPPTGPVLDWGCGSGIAGRAWLEKVGGAGNSLLLWDRSAAAMDFAKRRAGERFPAVPVQAGPIADQTRYEVLLLSHVLTELDKTQLDQLLLLASRATSVLWVEPGTYDASRRLSRIRDRMREAFHVVAPCTHQAACPALAPGNAAHWCHHFASPPPAVFTDGNWPRFAAMAGIDLRSLPLSFLVLDKRPTPSLPVGAVRILGRPRVYKGYALLLGCDATGLHERRLSKRTLPDRFRALKKEQGTALEVWKCQGDEILDAGTL